MKLFSLNLYTDVFNFKD